MRRRVPKILAHFIDCLSHLTDLVPFVYVGAAALYHNTLNQTKKKLVITAMDHAKGNHIEAARLLGIHPKYLHRLIKNLNLKSELKRLE